MKLDKNSKVYINCRTQEEQDMILDIFECLNARWASGSRVREIRPYTPPMNLSFSQGTIRHGSYPYEDYERMGVRVVEARDFRNQWIALKRGLDK